MGWIQDFDDSWKYYGLFGGPLPLPPFLVEVAGRGPTNFMKRGYEYKKHRGGSMRATILP